MRYYKPRHIILGTTAPTGSGAAVFISDQIIWANKNRVARYLDIEPKNVRKETAITSETAGVVILTPSSPTNDTTYSFTLVQLNPNATGTQAERVERVISVTTPATGTVTATTIVTQFNTEYFSLASNPFNVAVTTGATLTLTASAGYPILWGSVYSSGGTVAVNNSVAGIDTRGLAADLERLGAPSSLVTGTAYTLYAIVNNEHIGQNNMMRVNQPENVYIWMDEAASGYSTWVTDMDAILDGSNETEILQLL